MTMFDNASRCDPIANPDKASTGPADLPQSVRVDARLKLHVDFHDGATRLTERREDGAFRFRFPRAHGRPPEAILVNVAGGLAGGDRVAIEVMVGEGASLSISSAAAERVYRSAGSTTLLNANLTLGERATGLWLPQETILHDGARIERRFDIDLAPLATLVFGEMLYFGRRASGEGYGLGAFRESWRVKCGGKLILADETRLSGDFSTDLCRPTALADHVAVATLLLASGQASEHLDGIRGALPDEPGLEWGASDLGGLVLLRFASKDAALLRRVFLLAARYFSGLVAQPFPRALMN